MLKNQTLAIVAVALIALMVSGAVIAISLVKAAYDFKSSEVAVNPWIPTSFNGHNYLFNSITHEQYQAIPLAYSLYNNTNKDGFDVTYSGCFQVQTGLWYFTIDYYSITFQCAPQLYPFTQSVNGTSGMLVIYWGYLNDSEICLTASHGGCNTNVYDYGKIANVTYSEVFS